MRRKSIAVAAIAALAASGGQAKSRDPGPPDKRQVTPGKFDRITVAGPFLVKVSTGKSTNVTLSGPRTMLDDTELFVRDGQLIIRWQEGASWSRNGNQGVDVEITLPGIRGATNLGAGSIDIDRVQTDQFVAQLASSGGISIHSIAVGQLTAQLAGSGSLALAGLEAKTMDADLAGSGGIRAAGQVDSAYLKLVSSGSFDNPAFTARNASIESAGAGVVRATVTNAAVIKSGGSGQVVLTGGAKCTVTTLSSGRVHCS